MRNTRAILLSLLTVALFSALPCRTLATDTAAPTADEAQQRLREGNQRFLDGQTTHPNADAARRTLTAKEGQHPFVTILACSDSRVPLEILFDQGIGDIFVIRVAGNVAGPDELGSLEYGAGHLHTPLLVVLGHTKCGAVGAAATHADVKGHVKKLVERIEPAVKRAHQESPNAKGDELTAVAVKENVWLSIADALKHSEEVRELVGEGKLKIVGAVYDIEAGKIEWLGQHPDQAKLVGEEKKRDRHEPKEPMTEKKEDQKPEAKPEPGKKDGKP